jgi:phage shock protein A
VDHPLRLHHQVRGWLTELRDSDPVLARLVGQAVLAILEAGEGLGAPLVVPLESALRPPADPRETLDYSYQRQLEALTKVRRAVADVATSRKRVELQAAQLEEAAARLAQQRAHALDAGRQDLVSEVRERADGVAEQLRDLRPHLSGLQAEEDRLTEVSRRLQAKVDAFRTHKETVKASYTAAEAIRRVNTAIAGVWVDDELEATAEMTIASTAAHEILQETADPTPPPAPPPAAPEPPGLMLLRPGAPDDIRASLLFVAEPPMTVLIAWQQDPRRLRTRPRRPPGDRRPHRRLPHPPELAISRTPQSNAEPVFVCLYPPLSGG